MYTSTTIQSPSTSSEVFSTLSVSFGLDSAAIDLSLAHIQRFENGSTVGGTAVTYLKFALDATGSADAEV